MGAPTPPFTVLSEEDAPKVDLTDPVAKEVGRCFSFLLLLVRHLLLRTSKALAPSSFLLLLVRHLLLLVRHLLLVASCYY